MRGLGDHLTIGERIAFHRRRRGYTQQVLAGLVGRSTDWLAKVETGRRKPPCIDMRAELARVLGVPLGELIGQPILMEDDRRPDDVRFTPAPPAEPWVQGSGAESQAPVRTAAGRGAARAHQRIPHSRRRQPARGIDLAVTASYRFAPR